MPIPLIAVISALSAGGSLVPHAAGGMIVTSAAAGGYIAGTYLSTAAITSILSVVTASAAAGTAAVVSAASGLVGSAGIFGTTLGATGITGGLMSVGLLPSTPVLVPVLAAGAVATAAAGCGYTAYRVLKMKRRLQALRENEESHFSEFEAKMVESIIKKLPRKALPKE